VSEAQRLWDLMQRAYEGDVWHGPALRPLLREVTAVQAAARPIPGAHTIWETTVHVAVHEDVVRRRIEGERIGELARDQSWPAVPETGRDVWRQALEHFEGGHHRLRQAVWDFPDARLNDLVPGRDYPFYLMLYGVVQHSLYHAGQIVVLMQAQGLTPLG
jgi:uncharacterized damage-inducible protein DinB